MLLRSVGRVDDCQDRQSESRCIVDNAQGASPTNFAWFHPDRGGRPLEPSPTTSLSGARAAAATSSRTQSASIRRRAPAAEMPVRGARKGAPVCAPPPPLRGESVGRAAVGPTGVANPPSARRRQCWWARSPIATCNGFFESEAAARSGSRPHRLQQAADPRGQFVERERLSHHVHPGRQLQIVQRGAGVAGNQQNRQFWM